MSEQRKDTFDAIAVAADRFAHKDDALLPPRQINWRDLNACAEPFSGEVPARDRLDSREAFDRRLEELRRQYRLWLRDLTPPDPSPRPRQSLNQFQFRYEEVSDRKDADRRYLDVGDWKPVRIPHYVGPASRWAAYYRTEFIADPSLFSRDRIWLCFRAVDYACQVYLNGHFVGSHKGFFSPFEFDVTEQIHKDRANILLVRIENDAVLLGNDSWPEAGGTWTQGDKIYAATGLGWDEPGKGWHHCPPGAGIYQPLYLESRSNVFVSDLFVRPDIDAGRIELRIETFGCAFREVPVGGTVLIHPRNFDGHADEATPIELNPAGPGVSEYRITLPFEAFKLWEQDSPHLYTLRFELRSKGDGPRALDCRDVTFGMRKFHQDTTQIPRGTFYLNNQPLILRGANTMGHEQRAVFEDKPEQLIDDLLIAKMANLNFLRITQRPVQSEVYDACDALGMMVQTDLPLFGAVRRGAVEEVARQAGEMERLIRSHASCVIVTFINEAMNPGHPEVVAKSHRLIDRRELLDLLECCRHMVHLYNPDRVVKEMDGDYDPPHRYGMPDRHCYCGWYGNHAVPIGKLHAGYLFGLPEDWFGGCGEYGSEGLDPWETMQRHYPKSWLPNDPDTDTWSPAVIAMAQTAGKQHQWFDLQTTAREWIAASQRHQAWATRLLTDALRRRADRVNSSAIHLLIDAYPAGWMKALVCVDRIPKPAFYEYVDALTPIALNLRTDRRAVWGGDSVTIEVWLLSDTANAVRDGEYRLVYQILDDQDIVLSRFLTVKAPPLSATAVGSIQFKTPTVDSRRTLTVSASLLNADGACVHDHSLAIEAFPKAAQRYRHHRISIVGSIQGAAADFATRLGAEIRPFGAGDSPDLIFVDSAAAWRNVAGDLYRYLIAGGRAVFFEDSGVTHWQVGDHKIQRHANSAHHFASRKTGHDAVQQLRPDDLFMWFNPETGYATPLIDHFVHAAGLIPITLTGAEQEGGGVRQVAASGELKIGRGIAIFNEVKALCSFKGEPRAFAYLLGLVDYMLLSAASQETSQSVAPTNSLGDRLS